MAASQPCPTKRLSKRVLQIGLAALAGAMLAAGSAQAYNVTVSSNPSTNG